MAHRNTFDQAIADQLNAVGMQVQSERYSNERNDEFGYRLLAKIDDAIDTHEASIAELEQLYQSVKALL